jgi:hypothetical protein
MRGLTVFLALCVAGLLAFIVIRPSAAPASTTAAAPAPSAMERGKYLVTSMGCGDCHSPHDQTGQAIKGLEYSGHPHSAPLPEWDPQMLKKGAAATIAPTFTAFAGPFGLAVAPNLTPDLETGLVVSADGLIASWRSGNHWKYNRPVLPPMPIGCYNSLTDDDIRAIHSYLMSLPPVNNVTPLSMPVMPAAPAAGGTQK